MRILIPCEIVRTKLVSRLPEVVQLAKGKVYSHKARYLYQALRLL